MSDEGTDDHSSVGTILNSESTLLRYVDDPFPFDGPLFTFFASDPKIGAIKHIAFVKKFVVIYDGVVYLYSPMNGHWLHIYCTGALRQLCNYIGADNVTVSFSAAIEPYIPLLKQYAPSIHIPANSICMGNLRYTLDLNDNVLTFIPAFYTYNIDTNGFSDGLVESYKYLSTFSVSPLNTMIFPISATFMGFTDKISKLMKNTLSEDSMRMITWHIGNALLEPVARHRLIFLYGKGGEGKTFLINLISYALSGTVHVLTRDYIGDVRAKLPYDELLSMASSRFMVYGDVEIKDGDFNNSCIKLLCGGDQHSTPLGVVKISATGFFGTNTLWWAKRSNNDRWRTRRTLAVRMNTYLGATGASISDVTRHDRIKFIADCVISRIRQPKFNVCIEVALVTVFGAKIDIAARGIVIDKSASFQSNLAATTCLSIAGDIKIDLLITLIESIDKDLVHSDPSCMCNSNLIAIRYIGIKKAVTWRDVMLA
ncbi:hypothetical protein HDV02_002483 [Globomyces sp. JEL0801]|nr:hypothetical protein HDV02_002483 [Globomyces sp. JEL0801]